MNLDIDDFVTEKASSLIVETELRVNPSESGGYGLLSMEVENMGGHRLT